MEMQVIIKGTGCELTQKQAETCRSVILHHADIFRMYYAPRILQETDHSMFIAQKTIIATALSKLTKQAMPVATRRYAMAKQSLFSSP